MKLLIHRIGVLSSALLLVVGGSLANLCVGQENATASPVGTMAKPNNHTRFTMKLRMDDATIAELKSSGFLKASVPLEMRNRIDGIRISRDYSFIAKPMVADRHVEKRRDVLIIHVDDAVLDRLDYQPFLSRVYYSNYSTVLLAYKKTIASQLSDESNVDRRKPAPSSTTQFFARIDEQRAIRGSIEGLKHLKMKTDFGSVEIDLNQIEGMRFQPDQPRKATVWLRNQNQITGLLEFDQINMICSWGVQPIKLAELMSVTRDRFTQLPELPTHPRSIDAITDN